MSVAPHIVWPVTGRIYAKVVLFRFTHTPNEADHLTSKKTGIVPCVVRLRGHADSRASHPARIVSIEEPLMTSDVVTAMAIGAASFVSAKQGSKELLRNLSYGRRSFWDGFISSFSNAVGRVLVSPP